VEFLLVFFVRELVVTVVCGAGCGWAAHTHAQVQQDIGKPQILGIAGKPLTKQVKLLPLIKANL
jgi:hypothetical protein